MKRLTAQESESRWEALRKRQKQTEAFNQAKQQQCKGNTLDPFDCSSLVVPPSKELVDDVLRNFTQRWKSLDERKVVAEDAIPQQHPPNDAATEETSQGGSSENNNIADKEFNIYAPARSKRGRHGERWGWHKGRVKLPYKFDYASRRSSPPPEDEDGDRLISLQNPSLQVSYEGELWSLFHSVPTIDELEQPVREDSVCSHSRKLCTELVESQIHPAMSRLRINDRHCLPPLPSFAATTPISCTTIRFECLRRQMKRGGSPDCYRLELEFLSTQTLADLHNSIVEMSKDDLWPISEELTASSGFFFIEDKFYTIGDVDYVTQIQKWLDDAPDQKDERYKNLPKLPRRSFLGINPKSPLEVKLMKQVQLGDINFRLGVRYCHTHHGDVECSVFVTDVCHTSKSGLPYPIVHDAWFPAYISVECEGCKRLSAVLVTPPGASMTNGCATALCKTCFYQLYPKSGATAEEEAVLTQKYHVWREQPDLSVGHESTDAPFMMSRKVNNNTSPCLKL